MGKQEKAIYAPGELGKVRERLGTIDDSEAKRIAQVLGGEVGVERSGEPPSSRQRVKGGGLNAPPSRRIVTRAEEEKEEAAAKKNAAAKAYPQGAPFVPAKASYRERVKMDRYAGQAEFALKSFNQVVQSAVSFFSPPPDYLDPDFVTSRMDEYYRHIEDLVLPTRTLFPRNNQRRNERLKKASAFAYAVLDTIRRWDIERISGDLTRLQARSRYVKSVDFSGILRCFYRALFILEKLDLEYHIQAVYKLIYRINSIENPQETREKNHAALIQAALSSLRIIRKDVRFLLYPLLMKLLSDRWFSYETFFSARESQYLAFIGASDADQIQPIDMLELEKSIEGIQREDDTAEKKAEKTTVMMTEAERKALNKGLKTLEILFPKAGWDRLPQYPDLYLYFRDVFFQKKAYALIAPTDPVLQAAVFACILRELLFGFRQVSFGMIKDPDENSKKVDELLDPILNNWYTVIENSFDNEYLPRLDEYCYILENNSKSPPPSYARRLIYELHWIKRLYFFPYYNTSGIICPPSLQKQNITSLYSDIRQLRRVLTTVAAGIEQANRMGGAEKNAPCETVENPWEQYTFQTPNSLSRRLDMILNEKKRNNASLIFFTLAVTVAADTFMNNNGSWAYSGHPVSLFRSVNGEGRVPSPDVDGSVDADALFRQSLKKGG